MTKFNPGDRVRRVAGADIFNNEQEGVVLDAWLTEANVTVLWDDGHRRGVYPHYLEVIKEPTVPTRPTAIGDRVRYLGQVKGNPGEPDRPIGTLGTVAADYIFPEGVSPYGRALFVQWDDGSAESTWIENVELVEPAPTEPESDEVEPAEPADLDLQALRERLLDKAIRASDGASTQFIIETAKAFEAYITEGTK